MRKEPKRLSQSKSQSPTGSGGDREFEYAIRTIFDSMSDGVLLADIETKGFHFGNKAICQMLGYSQERITSLELADIHPLEYLPEVIQTFDKQAKEELWVAKDLPMKRRDGSVFYADVNAFPLMLDGKKYLTGIFRDTTERRQVEKALQKSETRFQELADFLPEAVYEIDLDGKFTFANQRALELSGYSREDLEKGADALQIVIPEDRARIKRNIAMILVGEKLGFQEYTAQRKDGSTCPVAIHSARVVEDGKVVGLRGIIIDITEHKRAEEALRESEERYRYLFEHAIDGVCIIDETPKVLLANQNKVKMFGLSSVEEFAGVDPFGFVHPEEKERVLTFMREDVFKNNLQKANEFRLRKKSGEEIWVSARGARIEYQGKVAALVSLRDVTVEKQTKQMLKEAEEQYRTLVDTASNAGEGIGVFQDIDGREAVCVFANDELCRLFGCRKEEILGLSPLELIAPVERGEALERYRKGQKGISISTYRETEIIRKDGQRVPIEVSAGVTTYNGKTAMITYVRDITERRRREAENKELQENLRVYTSQIIRSEEASRSHLARELHDVTLQELLIAVHHLDDISAGVYGQLPNRSLRHLKEVRVMLTQTADGLRRFACDLRPSILEDMGLISALRWLADTLLVSDEFSSEVRVIGEEKPLPPEFNLTLFRIAQEALTNVRKHAKASLVELVLEFTEEKVIMSVTDNGTGFEMPPRETYFVKQGKLGHIGMYERARTLGGTCRVESELGKGTVVRIEIPSQSRGY